MERATISRVINSFREDTSQTINIPISISERLEISYILSILILAETLFLGTFNLLSNRQHLVRSKIS